MSGTSEKRCIWIGSSLKDLKSLPDDVIDEFGFALSEAQSGRTPHNAKALKGFGSAGVLEVLESHDGNAYRAVYTVQFEDAIYVLHVFQKKSSSGRATPKPDMNKIEVRLQAAKADHVRRRAARDTVKKKK